MKFKKFKIQISFYDGDFDQDDEIPSDVKGVKISQVFGVEDVLWEDMLKDESLFKSKLTGTIKPWLLATFRSYFNKLKTRH